MQSNNAEDIDVKAFVKAWLDGKYLEIIDPTAQLAKFKEEFEALVQRTKQDCRGGNMADKIKEKANKMRSMSDKELVGYVENRVEKARSEGFNKGYNLRKIDVNNLTDFIIEMENYINDISTSIKHSYFDDLHEYLNGLYNLTAKLYRRGYMIGDGQSTLSDSTLMNLPKKELVDIIRLLEKNCKVYLNNLNTYSGIVKELTEAKEDLIEVGGIRSNGKNQN